MARLTARISRSRSTPESTLHIRVKGGFEPETVVAPANEPLRLVFRREETASCSERVVFPELGRSATLLAFHDVGLDLPPLPPAEYAFTCQLGVLRGVLVLTAGDGREAR